MRVNGTRTRIVYLAALIAIVAIAVAAGGRLVPTRTAAAMPAAAPASAAIEVVSTDWLAGRLNDPSVVMIDTQPNIHDYITEHIPGAVYLNEGFLREPNAAGMPGAYVPDQSIEAVLGRIGVGNDSAVVVYSGSGAFSNAGGGLEQTMMAYSLSRLGVQKVYLLDGGLNKWKAENRPLGQEFPRIQQRQFKAVAVPAYVIVGADNIKQAKDQPGTLLIDARPASVYTGKGPWPRPGHIPGAINLDWHSLMSPDNPFQFRSADEMREMFEAIGATPEEAIIVSCGTGREATDEFIILRHILGYPNVRIYEGSFTEWTADPNNPTVTGANPQ